MNSKKQGRPTIPAIKTSQWLNEWDKIIWSEREYRSKPLDHFHIFSIAASDLKKLSGVYQRTTNRKSSKDDLGVQRRHEPARSVEIEKFVKYGYPWSDLSEKKRSSGEFKELRNPGWLPTAIVINILTKKDLRKGKSVDPNDLISITSLDNNHADILLPKGFEIPKWDFNSIPPVEIIDGQHRLWAFEDSDIGAEYQLPVVAFTGLDLSWQAYLFYTINIKPKRINASLAFDLYPLLRTEAWLNKFEGHVIYKETRAQEIVDILWSHEASPWHKRINMLGESGLKGKMVTQSAWIRSLLASYIKSREGQGVKIGGLYGAPVGANEIVLPWKKTDQAAYLIEIGNQLKSAFSNSETSWLKSLREAESDSEKEDAALYGRHSLLNQDQGIRVFLQITNDISIILSDFLKLDKWEGSTENLIDEDESNEVNIAINSLQKNKKIMTFIGSLAKCLAKYDWRASSSPDLSEDEKLLKAAFRGSGGYKELRKSVLNSIIDENDEEVSNAAKEVYKKVGFS